MALTTQELNTVNWEWDQGGDQWGFDPRRTSLPHPDETAARNALSSSQIDAIVLAHKWKVVRKKRDDLLIASDWTKGADVPKSIKSSWTTYRQALRDVPTQSDPDNITWPNKPS